MIVVTGGTGNVGLELTRLLAEAGEDVTAVSRGIAPMDGLVGVEHQSVDLADPESLYPVVAGADAVFLMLPDSGGHLDPGRIVQVVAAAGVSNVVLLSSQAVTTRPEATSQDPLRRIEDAIERSGLTWTHLRPGVFASNVLIWSSAVPTTHTIAAPFADVALPVVDPRDIAEVAATALRQPGHEGRTYLLMGPEPISPRQQAEVVADALGEPITFVELTGEQAHEHLSTAGMPEPLIETALAFTGAPLPEERQVGSDTAAVLGRSPRTFGAWVQRNLAAFRLRHESA